MDLARFFQNDADPKLAALMLTLIRESERSASVLSHLMAEAPANVVTHLGTITALEQAGDKITDQLRDILDEAFILKQLPKEHVSRLVSNLDDILDDMRDAARYMDTYQIQVVTSEGHQFAAVISDMVIRLAKLIERLLKLTTDEVQEAFNDLQALEERADNLRSDGVKALVIAARNAPDIGAKTDAMINLTAWKDIYAKLERVTDHCLHAVNEIAIMVRGY